MRATGRDRAMMKTGRAARVLIPVVLVALALIAPAFAPYDPMQTDALRAFLPPGQAHPLGTDAFGRDVLSRVLVGGQRTVGLAAGATLAVLFVGGTAGMIAGYAGGVIDGGISALVRSLLALPGLLIALVAVSVAGRGDAAALAAVALSQVAFYAQYARALARSVGGMDYIVSAQALGATPWRIIARHVAPNCAPQLIGYAGVTLGYCILTGAGLGFLGVIGEPGQPEWGTLLAEGRQYVRVAPWIGAAAGAVITGFVLAVNLSLDHLTRHG